MTNKTVSDKNKELYKQVRALLDKTPGLSEAAACKQLGASYVGYRWWAHKPENQRQRVKGTNPDQKPLSPLSPLAIAQAVKRGQESINISIKDYVASMDRSDIGELLDLIGKI